MGFFRTPFESSRQSAGDEEPVLAELNQAITNDPGDFLAYVKRGDLFRERGSLMLAIKDYSSAIECYRGRLDYLRTGQVGGAAPLKDALKKRPEVALACFHRGCSYSQLGKFEQAMTDFTELIQASPKSEYYLERARTYRAQGELEKAISDEQKAIEPGR